MRVTRRSFLIGTGSSTIAGPAFADRGTPAIALEPGRVRITYGRDPAWVLEACGFGPAASLSADSESLSISVKNASFAAGTPFDLQLDLRKSNTWQAHLRSDGLSVGKAVADLASVMDGSAAIVAPITRARAREMLAKLTGLSETTGMRVQIPDRVGLALRRPIDRNGVIDRSLSFSLAVEARRSKFLFPRKIRASGIQLAPAPRKVDPNWCAELVGAAIPRTIPLGVSGSSTAELGLSPFATASIVRDPRSNGTRLRLSDRMRLDIVTGASREGPIRCTAAEIAEASDLLQVSLRLEERRWQLETTRGLFGVSGGMTASSGARAEAYTTTIEAKKGRLTVFDVSVGLHEHGVEVPGTDMARFDFGGATARLWLPGVGKVEPPLALPLGSRPGAKSYLPLDGANLRLIEGRSLMSLTYRFKDFDLVDVDGKRWLQERLGAPKKPGGPEASKEDDPGALLVVDFPPQHVLEKVYPKREPVLPDRDLAVAPADLRAVHGDSPTRAGDARHKIADAKLADEAADPGLADVTPATKRPFAAFSERWSKASVPKQEIPWIGPQGLLSVAARKAARGLTVQMVADDLGANAARLSQLPADAGVLSKAIGDAVKALAFPNLGLSLHRMTSAASSAQSADQAVAAVFEAAAVANEDFDALQKQWAAWAAQNPPNPRWFITEQWPGELASRELLDAVLPQKLRGQSPTRVAPATAAPFLAQRLKEAAVQVVEDSKSTLNVPNECHLSGPSRLAFAVRTDAVKAKTDPTKPGKDKKSPVILQLTRDDLTRWSDFELRVVRRAIRYVDPKTKSTYTDVAKILEHQGFPSSGAIGIDQWMATVVANAGAPTALETALELPSRLILSPAQDVLWKTPRPLRHPIASWFAEERNTPVWEAEYFETNIEEPGLRAVWSPDFRPGNFLDPTANRAPDPGPYAPWAPKRATFPASVDARDRHELVALTSLYGLLVLARRDTDGTLDSSQARIPASLTLNGLKDGNDVALYLPKGLSPRRLAMSSLGVSLDLDTPFTPPATARRQKDPNAPPQQLFETLNLAHFTMRTSYGYEELVEVLRKGFLLPVGNTAAFVKTTRREIWGKGGPIAFPVQRLSVKVITPQQIYGHPVQNFEGRNFPARAIELLTSTTPDLIDPRRSPPPNASGVNDLVHNALGRVGGVIGGNLEPGTTAATPRRPLSGLVFWPRTQPNEAGNVRFRMRIDGSADTVYMPLLFVENEAAHDPDAIQGLVQDYYNRDPKVEFALGRWNVVAHGGAPRAYGIENNPGDTTYATDWQEIDVEGRSGPSPYTFDPALEALDQPPFFPKLRQAQVRAGQIGRLTGQPAPDVLVAFNQGYLKAGFTEEAEGKPPVTFLDVVGQRPRLDMAKQGDRAGGVGRPSQEVVGFSRRIGPVGGSPARNGANATPQPIRYARSEIIVADASSPAAPTPTAGFFDEHATLLGIIKLNELLKHLEGEEHDKALPALKEVTEYAAHLGVEIIASLNAVTKQLRDAFAASGATNLGYGALGDRLNEFQGAIDVAQHCLTKEPGAAETSPDDDPLPSALATVWASGQRLAAELQRLARAPLAPAVTFLTDVLRKVEVGWSDALAAHNPVDAVRQAVAEALAGIAKSDLAPAIIDLGPTVGLPGSVAANVLKAASDPNTWLASDPAAVLAASARAGLSDQLITAIDAHALKGPLWDRFDHVIKTLQLQADQGLAQTGRALQGLRRALDEVTQRYQAVAAAATKLCVSGTQAAQAWAQAAMPADAIAPSSVASLTDASDSIVNLSGDLKTLIANLPPNDQQIARPIIAWSDRAQAKVKAARDAITAAAATLRDARADLLMAIGPGNVCAIPSGLGAAIDHFDGARRNWGTALSAWIGALDVPENVVLAGEPGKRVRETADKLRAATAAAVSSIQQTSLGATVTATYPSTELKALFDADAVTRGLLQDADDGLAAAIGSDARRMTAIVDDAAKQVSSTVQTLNESVKAAQQFVKRAQDLRVEMEDRTRALLGRLFDAALSQTASYVVQAIATALDFASVAAKAAYAQILKARNDALASLSKPEDRYEDKIQTLLGPAPKQDDLCPGGWIASLLLVKVTGKSDACTPDADALAGEAKEVATPSGFGTALARWESGSEKPAPVRLIEQTRRIAEASIRAAVTRMLDVQGLRQQLLDALRDLVPLRRTLSYDMKLPLTSVDAGFVKLGPVKDRDPLVLTSRTTMAFDPVPDPSGAFSRPTVSSTFQGTLPPVDVTIPEVLTIRFKPITFVGGTGRTSSLDAELDHVTIESALDVLEKLKDLLGRGDQGGPYVLLRQDMPAIEAGYVLSVGTFTVGDLAILNINLVAALVLPFDGSDARINLSLGTVDQPFLLSMAPYGGGGFFGIEAGASGITASAASFEYGGVAAVDYGPLQAIGRITTGLYVRQSAGSAVLSAIFFAGFSGHIACFGIATTFTLRLAHEGGRMSGTADLEFTFSFGFGHVSFSIKVGRTVDNNLRSAALSVPDGPIRLASADDAFVPGSACAPGGARIRTACTGAEENWFVHEAYYDHGLRPAEVTP